MSKITINNVSKTFTHGKNDLQILNDISLTLSAGTMTALIGPSGIGKSTLLNIIGLLDRRYQGSIVIDDYDTIALSDKELAKLRNSTIGFVLQEPLLIEKMSIKKNILLPTIYGVEKPKQELENRLIELTQKVGIQNIINKHPSQISGGQKQRAVLARALINNPDIILADEPTGSLDEQNSEIVVDIFQQLVQQGKTILTVTHDYAVANCHQHIWRLDNGKLINEE